MEHEYTFVELLQKAVEKIKEEYGTVANFANERVEDIPYTPNTGGKLRVHHIQMYLSLPRKGEVKKNQNFKFLTALYSMWGIELKSKRVLNPKTILTANKKL